MPPWVLDLIIGVIILGMTYALTSEGLWGSALVFFNVLFAALIALNFYEPLARLIAENASAMAGWADMLCLLGLYLVSLVIFKLTTETLAPSMVRYPAPLYQVGRLVFGLAGALATAAFLIVALQTAPVHRKIFGVIDWKYAEVFGLDLDTKLLAFFQYTTGQPFATYGSGAGDPSREYGDTYVFDRRSSWQIDHQNARPVHGDTADTVPEDAGTAAEGGGGGGGGGEAGAGSPGPGPMPGPQGASGPNAQSPQIPGGTAGAAVGLAPQQP